MRLAGHVGRWDGPFPNVPNRGIGESRDRAVFLSQRGQTRVTLQSPLTFGTLGQRFWKDKELYKGRFPVLDRAKHPSRQVGGGTPRPRLSLLAHCSVGCRPWHSPLKSPARPEGRARRSRLSHH
jgi:hypothetical protein